MSADDEARRQQWSIGRAVNHWTIPPSHKEFPRAVEHFMTNKHERRIFDQQEAVRELKRALRDTTAFRGLLRFNHWLARRLT